MFGFPSLPAIEAMLMIRPDLRAFMPAITACDAQKDAVHVDLQDAAPVLVRERLERRSAARDAGVVHQDVDGP